MTNLSAFDALPCLGPLAGEKAVAVALSGGPDSMALAWLLARWAQNRKGPALHALTVDHGLRPESAAEAEQVGSWIGKWPGLRHAILTMKPLKNKTRLMENARRGRYALMADYCRKKKIRYLLLAHHLDDQAETFLFRLAKGSGLDGLGAMRAAQELEDGGITLIRPLLDVPKEGLVALCVKNKIPFVRDPANENPAYARGRLRHAREALEREGLSAKRMAVTASRLARAREALDSRAEKTFDAALREKTKKRLVLDHEAVAGEPAEIRLRVVLKAAGRFASGKAYGPSLEKMEILALDLFAPGPFRRRTLGGLIFSRKKNEIYIEKEK